MSRILNDLEKRSDADDAVAPTRLTCPSVANVIVRRKALQSSPLAPNAGV